MSASLLTHNILYLIGGILNVGVAAFVLVASRKKVTNTVLTFALMSFSVAIFQISHLIGTNMPDAVTSRAVFMFNLSDIFIGMFMAHWFIALIGKAKERKLQLRIIYGTGLALFAYFLIQPQMFLVNSVPKLYFPFYYEPGPLYILMPVWFMLVGLYYFYELNKAYHIELDTIQKNRLRYALASISYAFLVGVTAFLLVFNIPFDPVWSSFFGLYTLPLAYAIITYELLDIRILARRALVYLFTMIFLGIAIGATNYIGGTILRSHPDFPQWILPAFLAILIGESGIYLWRKAKQEDMAKYEFVNLVTHKFRGPLTQVKWATDLVSSESVALSEASRNALQVAQDANSKMFELTNALVTLNDADNKKFAFKYSTFSLLDVVKDVIDDYRPRYKQKNVDLGVFDAGTDTTAYGDAEKMRFVIDILLNNALTYTPAGGKVTVRFWPRGKYLEMSVHDNGIGIPNDAAPFIFTKFYRADNARRATVDGTGIGLYLANEIVKRNGGSLSYFSQGPGTGTTFVVNLPIRI